MARGIVNGSTWNEVAEQLANRMTSPFTKAKNNAMRIVRTEGHRINMTSQMDACREAKKKGADVVKQWDSTLDGRTRSSHAVVDGELRELDETFSNGLMMPGDPNAPAAEVCNCRCALLQRARWALGETELDTLKERAEYFGLDKTDNFEEFKSKYLDISENIQYNENNRLPLNLQLFAKIPKEKFTKYALDPIKQPDKALAFRNALGYTIDNYQDLIDNINANFDQTLMKFKGNNDYGELFECVMELTGVNGKTANVCTSWIIKKNGTEPRLTSAYVTKKGVTKNGKN